jgi:hypothetical protein
VSCTAVTQRDKLFLHSHFMIFEPTPREPPLPAALLRSHPCFPCTAQFCVVCLLCLLEFACLAVSHLPQLHMPHRLNEPPLALMPCFFQASHPAALPPTHLQSAGVECVYASQCSVQRKWANAPGKACSQGIQSAWRLITQSHKYSEQ